MKSTAIYDRIERDLSNARQKNLFRSIPGYDRTVHADLSSNSYLSLHTNPQVASEAFKLLQNRLAGNRASRLIATNSPLYGVLEQDLAAWKSAESSLVFNTGYAANTGVIKACANKDSVIFSDRLNHASIIDGILLSGATCIRYRHCDVSDLEGKLQSVHAKERIIITDSVFSMDGDRAPLVQLVELAQRYQCLLMVDEAHASGILGPTGGGLAEELNLENDIDIRISTLSKAVAGFGGFFAGSRLLYDFFVNVHRGLIYSTALPHSVLSHNCAAVQYIRNHPGLGTVVLEKAALFRIKLHELGFDTLQSSTQIIPCVLGSEGLTIDLAQELKNKGIRVAAIRPPTVPAGSARLRFSIHLDFTQDMSDEIIDILRSWKKLHGI